MISTSMFGLVVVLLCPGTGTATSDSQSGSMMSPTSISGVIGGLPAVNHPAEIRVVDTIVVGSGPAATAYDPLNQKIYVGNIYDYTLSVIDGSSQSVIRTLLAGSGPYFNAFDPANGCVYEGNAAGNTVTVVSALSTPSPVVPANIAYFLPIRLVNHESKATSEVFQQAVEIESSVFSSYEDTSLQNIEFVDASGTILPSWLEFGNSRQSTNSLYWLRLGESIDAYSSLTVFMGFGPLGTNFFTNGRTGEAPGLSPS